MPNLFTVELSESDYDRLSAYDEELEKELVAAAQEHAESQRYQPGGPLQVNFATADDLETGVFRLAHLHGAAPRRATHPRPAPAPGNTPLDEDGLEATQAQAPVARLRRRAGSTPPTAPGSTSTASVTR